MEENRPTRTDIELALMRIWHEVLDVDALRRTDDFFELGGDSIAAAKVMAQIEKRLGRKLPMSAIVDNPTVALMSARIRTESTDSNEDGQLLIPVRRDGARPPLFMVHGLMGHVVFAHVLAKFIGPDQPIYALQAQGFDGKPPLGSVAEMTRAYLEHVRSIQPKAPYFLGGNCSGAFVAVEMGRMLLQAGERVGLMFAVDPMEPGISFTQWRVDGQTLSTGDERSDAFRANLRQRLESEVYGRGGIDSARMGWAIDVATALDLAIANHHPAPYPGRITMIASEERAKVLGDPAMPWRKLAGGGMALYVAAKQHHSLFVEHGATIAKIIRKAMDESMNARKS